MTRIPSWRLLLLGCCYCCWLLGSIAIVVVIGWGVFRYASLLLSMSIPAVDIADCRILSTLLLIGEFKLFETI